jgi:hypothetical protein
MGPFRNIKKEKSAKNRVDSTGIPTAILLLGLVQFEILLYTFPGE